MNANKIYLARISRPYLNCILYDDLVKWVKYNTEVYWEYPGGFERVNGYKYWSMLVFPDEETMIICKLMFPEIVCTK